MLSVKRKIRNIWEDDRQLALGFRKKLDFRKDFVHQKSYFRQVWIFSLNFVLSACERECCCAIHIFLPPRSSETLQWRYIHELRHNNDFIQIFHQFFSAKNPDFPTFPKEGVHIFWNLSDFWGFSFEQEDHGPLSHIFLSQDLIGLGSLEME